MSVKYKDQIGSLETAVGGGTTWTWAQYRTTGIAGPVLLKNDLFSKVIQINHDKARGLVIPSVHLHYVPLGAVTGNVSISYSWGWFNHNTEIPATLPNTSGSPTTWEVLGTDQFKLKVKGLLFNVTPPANEDYSSFLLVTFQRANGTPDTYTGNLHIMGVDAHIPVDRDGSVYEYSDTPPGGEP